MITDLRSSWLLNEFSLSAPKEMYGEQYREYLYWCLGVRSLEEIVVCAIICQTDILRFNLRLMSLC